MWGKENKSAGKFNRRIQLLKPSVVRDPVSNEEKVEDVIVYNNFPAYKKLSNTGNQEDQNSNLITSESKVVWIIRFIPNLSVGTDWKIKDLFDGITYSVTAPAVEVDFRQGYQILTQLVQ